MITRAEYNKINSEVANAVKQVYDNIKRVNVDNYILLLSNIKYIDSEGYMIDDRDDEFKDVNRLRFLEDFLNTYYNFPSNQLEVEDDNYRLNLELMIYSHIWESKPFLKSLSQASHILSSQEYSWNLKVPDYKKHEYISQKIKQLFKNCNSKISEIIEKSYHSSLRNAFAHSDYSISTINEIDIINLHNYSGKQWELKSISLYDWSRRFLYSALLTYHFYKTYRNRRTNIINDLGEDTYVIPVPIEKIEYKTLHIKYEPIFDDFSLFL